MSNKSNNQGRAYEFICLLTLNEEINKIRPARIIINSSYLAAQRAWKTLNAAMQNLYKISSYAAVAKIVALEPRMIEKGEDVLDLLIQADEKGENGDVRDILIIRNHIHWEIGLSLKHNHFAVKHSRLSDRLDFGNKWYGIPCSQNYWDDIRPIFSYLHACQKKHLKFKDLPDKDKNVYVPLLKAFIYEIQRQYSKHKNIPSKLVEYLLGEYDFYKIISIDKERMTQIQSYNLHGTLGMSSQTQEPAIIIPIASLPTRIVSLDFVPGKQNTVELYMDKGWQFSFRIHNAKTDVEPSLKFDIQLVGMPAAIITLNCFWE